MYPTNFILGRCMVAISEALAWVLFGLGRGWVVVGWERGTGFAYSMVERRTVPFSLMYAGWLVGWRLGISISIWRYRTLACIGTQCTDADIPLFCCVCVSCYA